MGNLFDFNRFILGVAICIGSVAVAGAVIIAIFQGIASLIK